MAATRTIAIVGLRFGRAIIDELRAGFAAEHFRLVAVCDRDADLAAAVATEAGVAAYTDITDLLADPDVEVVGLFTGPVGRAALVGQIIRAGRDVMTTKPFELDPRAALAVLQEAADLGRVVHLNSPSPLPSPDLTLIDRWRVEYDLGRAVGCRAETWAPYHEEADGSWYDDPELCPVAPVFRLGIYLVNDLVHLLGEAEEVRVLQSHLRTGRPTPDNGQLAIRFRNGALANVFASFCIGDGQLYRNALVLNHERGTIYRNHGPARSTGDAAHGELVLVRPGQDGDVVVEGEAVDAHSGSYQWDAFRRAVDGEVLEGAVAPEEIVAGLRIIEAMALAEQSGGAARVLR